jgi:hypothetical protein
MEKTIQETGLSPERIKRIREAQKRHTRFDPGCERWSPEEFINWHPANGMSWEERAEAMRAAGVVDPNAGREQIAAMA